MLDLQSGCPAKKRLRGATPWAAEREEQGHTPGFCTLSDSRPDLSPREKDLRSPLSVRGLQPTGCWTPGDAASTEFLDESQSRPEPTPHSQSGPRHAGGQGLGLPDVSLPHRAGGGGAEPNGDPRGEVTGQGAVPREARGEARAGPRRGRGGASASRGRTRPVRLGGGASPAGRVHNDPEHGRIRAAERRDGVRRRARARPESRAAGPRKRRGG